MSEFFKIYIINHLKSCKKYFHYIYISYIIMGVFVAFAMGIASLGTNNSIDPMGKIIESLIISIICLIITIFLILFPVFKINKKSAKQYCYLNNAKNLMLVNFLYNTISFIVNIILSVILLFLIMSIGSLIGFIQDIIYNFQTN